jgi:hypothetical protein
MKCECCPGLLILQWVARVTGLALLVLVLAIAIGEGGPPMPLPKPPAVAAQLLLMLVMTLGLIVAWRWELAGAIATLAGFVGFNIVQVAGSRRVAGGVFPLFAVAAALYLTHALLQMIRSRADRPSGCHVRATMTKSDAEIGATPNRYEEPRRYLE